MGYPGQRRQFGSKQPSAASQGIVLKGMIASATDNAALDRMQNLARSYRADPREVECWIGARRRQLSEVATQ